VDISAVDPTIRRLFEKIIPLIIPKIGIHCRNVSESRRSHAFYKSNINTVTLQDH
jgi:hypothetical protein